MRRIHNTIPHHTYYIQNHHPKNQEQDRQNYRLKSGYRQTWDQEKYR